MSKSVPWLMHHLCELYSPSTEYGEEDWLNAFQQCDPRKKFSAELCDKCYSRVTVRRYAGHTHVISKDEVAIGELLLCLYDGTCPCPEVSKTRFEICLLDGIAASGKIAALRACMRFFRSLLTCTGYRNKPDTPIGSSYNTITHFCDFIKPDSETDPLHKPVVGKSFATQEINVTKEVKTTSSQERVKKRVAFSTEGKHARHRLLLSPNCDGGYGERKQFPSNSSDVFDDDVLDQQMNSASCCNASFSDADYLHQRDGKPNDPVALNKDRTGREHNDNVCQNVPHQGSPGDRNDIDRLSLVPCVQPPPSCLLPSKSGWGFQESAQGATYTNFQELSQEATHTDFQGLTPGPTHTDKSETVVERCRPGTACRVPSPSEEHCPLVCCFPSEEVTCLRENVDQATLLSMSIQALYYNHGSMMVCARALTTASLSSLVSISAKLPLTSALLYLYFMSLDEKEIFSEVPLEDMFLLHERTLSLEVSRLCQLAWTDVGIACLFHRARHTSLHIDMCADCEAAHFPDVKMYLKTSFVKFRRDFHDNTKLFTYIENRACPCSTENAVRTKVHKWRMSVMPEMAAAASGNIDMMRTLIDPSLGSHTATDKSVYVHTMNQGQPPQKSCIKNSQSTRRPGASVDFQSDIEHLGESKFCIILQHTLYGGHSSTINYILSKMNPWPLLPGETMKCLKMCMLTSRDDLFFRLSLMAESSSGNGTTNGTTVSGACSTDTPLMMAAAFGRTLLVNLLLERGADPTVENWDGVTAVQMAFESEYEDSEMIAIRMMTAAPNCTLHKTLIARALRKERLRVVKFLIGKGVKTVSGTERNVGHRSNPWRMSPAMEIEMPLVQWCLDSAPRLGSDLDFRDLLDFMLSQGLNAGEVDLATGDTPLHRAVLRHHGQDVLELIISHGASVNVRTANGSTPLFYALKENRLDHFAPLLRAGATISDKQVFFDAALAQRRFQVVFLLLHAGYKPSFVNLEALAGLRPGIPDDVQIRMSLVMSEPPSLPTLCALSLREALGDKLNPYLEASNCPNIVRRFIHLEHLLERFAFPLE